MYKYKNKWVLSALVVVLICGGLVIGIQYKLEERSHSKLSDLHKAIKDTYGDFYIPSRAIDADELELSYGISMDDVDSYIAESAMMSTYADVFLSFKAVKGRADVIETELKNYRGELLAQFSDNKAVYAKIEASQVFRYGDYVIYMVVGQNSDSINSDESTYHEQAKSEFIKCQKIVVKLFK
ncbi:MAG: hypothetical protein BGO41_09960 [Clostridiales bacterium 38-18]|nr:MAG: hypothetical protein BGO41_09960 [Clostridiales bacterium 38-18]